MLTTYKTTGPKGEDSYYFIVPVGNEQVLYEGLQPVGTIVTTICLEKGKPLNLVVLSYQTGNPEPFVKDPVTEIYPPPSIS